MWAALGGLIQSRWRKRDSGDYPSCRSGLHLIDALPGSSHSSMQWRAASFAAPRWTFARSRSWLFEVRPALCTSRRCHSCRSITEQIQKAKRQKLKRTRDCHVAALVAARIRITPLVPSRSMAHRMISSLRASATIAILLRDATPRLTRCDECLRPVVALIHHPRHLGQHAAQGLGPRRVILPTRFIVPLSNCLGTNPA